MIVSEQTSSLPLRSLRYKSGIRLTDAATQLSGKLGRNMKALEARRYLILLENRGTSKHEIMQALAEIYSVGIECVASASLPPQKNISN